MVSLLLLAGVVPAAAAVSIVFVFVFVICAAYLHLPQKPSGAPVLTNLCKLLLLQHMFRHKMEIFKYLVLFCRDLCLSG